MTKPRAAHSLVVGNPNSRGSLLCSSIVLRNRSSVFDHGAGPWRRPGRVSFSRGRALAQLGRLEEAIVEFDAVAGRGKPGHAAPISIRQRTQPARDALKNHAAIPGLLALRPNYLKALTSRCVALQPSIEIVRRSYSSNCCLARENTRTLINNAGLALLTLGDFRFVPFRRGFQDRRACSGGRHAASPEFWPDAVAGEFPPARRTIPAARRAGSWRQHPVRCATRLCSHAPARPVYWRRRAN